MLQRVTVTPYTVKDDRFGQDKSTNAPISQPSE